MDAKVDDKISSLKEESHKEFLKIRLEERRNTSLTYINVVEAVASQVGRKDTLETCSRAHKEIKNLGEECFKQLHEASATEVEKIVARYTSDINRITRAAGLGEIWKE